MRDDIVIAGITKDYGGGRGVFDLSLTVRKGEVFGFLGPNGAGKTTTLRQLMGFIRPDRGSLTIDGLDCWKNAPRIQQTLGYLPGEIAFMDEMTGRRFIRFIADVRGLSDMRRADQLIERFELDTRGRIRKMSKGTKQKIGIVLAFMHDPAVLLLDEPTSGLDPLMQRRFAELVNEEKARGKTIFMSSHQIEEVERTCDRVGIIRAGRLIAVDSIENLTEAKRKSYQIRFADEDTAQKFSRETSFAVGIEGDTVTAAVKGEITPLIESLSGYRVVALQSVAETLEEAFMHYYGGEERA